jgi:hypothetical protein
MKHGYRDSTLGVTAMSSPEWPSLVLEEWLPTYATLHRWAQIVGKTRLSLAPFENHWWHCALYVTARGLTTSPMPHRGGVLEIEFDFLDDLLVARTSDGDARQLRLEDKSVADFYHEYRAMLAPLGLDVRISPTPNEVADATPFAIDRAHATYDGDAARRCWHILLQANRALRSRSHAAVWALGDCAAIPGPDGRPYPALAQHASREARQLARNVVAVVSGRAPAPFVFRTLGTFASLGHSQAVAEVFGVRITGFVAWWLRRTYYLFEMPRWDRRLRMVLDWTVALFFRPDITKVDLAVEQEQTRTISAAGASVDWARPRAVENYRVLTQARSRGLPMSATTGFDAAEPSS